MYGNFVAVDGLSRQSMAATDGLPLTKVIPQYFAVLYNFYSNTHYYRELISK